MTESHASEVDFVLLNILIHFLWLKMIGEFIFSYFMFRNVFITYFLF